MTSSLVHTTVSSIRYDDAVDLHLHTLASDGAWTPDALVAHLAGHRFRVAAVCDHDTQRSVPEALRLGAERGIQIVPGVEVTTRWADRQWHLLVYGIDPARDDADSAPFRTALAEQDAALRGLAEDARRRLEDSGRSLPSLPELIGKRPMWPFHVLSAAIKDGHVPALKEAAELVRELGGDFTTDLPLARVVEAAHRAGGVCVIAHPGRSDSIGVMTEADLTAMLAAIPIDGLEAHYRSYTDAQTALYRDLAARHGLLVSCGSDSHAPGVPVDPRPWRAAWCAPLLERLGISVEPVPNGAPIWEMGMDPLAATPAPPEETAAGSPSAPSDGIERADEPLTETAALTHVGARSPES